MLNFVGIGAQKCGTTWLYEMLKRHPEIQFPAGKEIQFWTNNQSRGLDWYKSLFPDNIYKNGEISPAYACLPQASIIKIRKQFPDLRLIFLMRNPIDRAWSAAKMMLARSEMTIDEASDQWFIDIFKSRGSLTRGDYATCLYNWLTVFPRDQLLIERYENISADPSSLLERCSRFVGIESSYDFAQHELNMRIHASELIKLRPSLRTALQELYADKIRLLSDYLNEDFSVWNEDITPP